MPMGLPTVIPGESIAATWGNSVADRVVGRFATTAERDAAITVPTTGMVCTVAGVVYVYRAGVWFVELERHGVSLSATGVNVTTGNTVLVTSWTENEDLDGMYTAGGSTVTIPAASAGVYSFSMYTRITNGIVSSGHVSSSMIFGGTPVGLWMTLNMERSTCAWTERITGGTAVTCAQIYNGTPGTGIFDLHFRGYRISA